MLLDDDLNAKVCDFGLARMARPARQHVVYSPFTGVTRHLPSVNGSIQMAGDQNGDSTLSAADIFVNIVGAQGTMTRATGTLLWMAPEMFRGDQNYGPKVDVYSFGIVLWELATRQEPWKELRLGPVFESREFFLDLNLALQTNRRPLVPDNIMAQFPRFIAVMRACW